MSRQEPKNIIEAFCRKKRVAKNNISSFAGVSKQTIFNAQNFKVSRKVAEKIGASFGKDTSEKNQFLIQNLLIPKKFARVCQVYPDKVLKFLDGLLKRSQG